MKKLLNLIAILGFLSPLQLLVKYEIAIKMLWKLDFTRIYDDSHSKQ